MNQSVKENLGRALRLMLKPVAKLLIDQGISHQEFSEAAKEAFVEMAIRDQVATGKINRSRIAIVTGLTRKEVAAVLARSMAEESHPRTFSRPGRVLHGWHNDPDYTGPYGMPLEIPYEAEGCGQTEPSFVNLVRTYSGDQSPVQMLDELLRVGAVIETEPQRYKPLRRDFEADRLSPKLIERFGDISFNLLTTLSFNVQKEKIGEGIFDRRVLSNQKLNANELELFESYLKSRGQQFLEEVDNWLTGTVVHKAEGATEVYDSGLAMIHYTTLEPELKQTLHELLIELGLDEATNGKGKNILKE